MDVALGRTAKSLSGFLPELRHLVLIRRLLEQLGSILEFASLVEEGEFVQSRLCLRGTPRPDSQPASSVHHPFCWTLSLQSVEMHEIQIIGAISGIKSAPSVTAFCEQTRQKDKYT